MSRPSRTHTFLLTACCGLLPLFALAQGADATGAAAPQARPRIGLVLSGGGARGTAHIGVLKMLDDLHVPIDAIAGTSMGAVIGGLYASGMTGREIQQLLSTVDWEDSFRDKPQRAELAFRRKRDDEDFLVNVPLGIRGRKLLIPTGLIAGQKLTQILRHATLPVAAVPDFDRLPTPLRVVATDLETGAPVILSSGDLTSAMRASMSAPGVFTPVERDGRLLVDGGLVKNLPIDVARTMGVDVLIVVDAGVGLQTRERLSSIATVTNQALAIMVRRDADQQRATLGPRDILLLPRLEDVSSYDFRVLERVIDAGSAAAEVQRGRLAQLAVPEPDYARYVARRAAQRAVDSQSMVQFVRADSGSTPFQRPIQDLFGDLVDRPFDTRETERRLTTLYGRGNLERLDYRLTTDAQGQTGLEFSARRNSWGPNYLRLGLSLQDDFAGGTAFNAAGRLLFTELNSLGAESVWDVQVGAMPRLSTELFLPLSNRSRVFVAPHAQLEAHNVAQLSNGQQIGEFRVRSFEYGLDAGREFGNWGEFRGGLTRTEGTTRVRIGDFSTPNSVFGVDAAFLRFGYDRLDSANFPRRGQALKFEWRVESDGRSGPGSDLLKFDWHAAWSRNKFTGVAWVSGGSTVGGSTANVRSYFPLGGFLNLSGLRAQSLAGPHYAIARGILLRNVGNGGEGVLNVPAYVGIALEAGNVWSQRSQISLGSAQKDAAVFFGADTYIGPAYLAVGYDESGKSAFYLFLGRSF
jgi:NTE family protein